MTNARSAMLTGRSCTCRPRDVRNRLPRPTDWRMTLSTYDATMGDGKTPRCQEKIRQWSGPWPRYGQCGRAAKVGDRCSQHDPKMVRAREAKTRARQKAKWNKQMVEMNGPHFLATLRKIAAGHNDARGLAQEAVAKFEKKP